MFLFLLHMVSVNRKERGENISNIMTLNGIFLTSFIIPIYLFSHFWAKSTKDKSSIKCSCLYMQSFICSAHRGILLCRSLLTWSHFKDFPPSFLQVLQSHTGASFYTKLWQELLQGWLEKQRIFVVLSKAK